jgi:cytochrome P450
MMRLTLWIVGKTLFDANVLAEADDVGGALTMVMRDSHARRRALVHVPATWPTPHNQRLRAARAQLDATVYRIIAERRQSGEDRGDLLSVLLRTRDQDVGGFMTDQQVRDEAMTLFLAGHETTANALTWTWYLLAQHPDVEARLHAEVDALGHGLPTAADLPRLAYTRMVLAESMRLYPPAWGMGRRALADVQIGGYTIPAGSLVLVSPYVTQRDARFFPDPGRFDPERWTTEAQAARPRFAYFPFGGGARQCIGEQFAWTEGILALATISRRWRLRLVPGHPVALHPLITLRPRHGMRMTVHERRVIPSRELAS